MRILAPLVALPVLLALARAPAAAQSGRVSGESVLQSPGEYALISHVERLDPLARGDTVRVREVVVNLADTAITVTVDPCRIRIGGTLRVEVPGGERQACPAAPARIAPGDSLAAERIAVVASPPGVYALEVGGSGLAIQGSGTGGGMSMSRVTVADAGASARQARTGRMPSARLPFVLQVSGTPPTGVGEHDLATIVSQVARQEGVIAMQLHPDAPAAAPGLLVLLVHVQWKSDGGAGIAMGYFRQGWSCGQSTSETGTRSSLAVFGADLAGRVQSQLRFYPRCFPRTASTAAR